MAKPVDDVEAFDVADAKRALRARMRAIRRVIASDPDRHRERSVEVTSRLIGAIGELPVVPRRVMTYRARPGEVDVGGFDLWCGEHDIAVFTPHVEGIDAPGPVADTIRVEPGDIDPETLDLVVVPGLAFTSDGHRLGQGGGHFDRFLGLVRPDCRRIGVAFREQLVAHLPVAGHDVMVDGVITDA